MVSVPNVGDPNGGSHPEPRFDKTCSHGEFVYHYYDSYGHKSRSFTKEQYSRESSNPGLAMNDTTKGIMAAYMINLQSKVPTNLPVGTVMSVKFTNPAKDFYGGDQNYLIPGKTYTVKVTSNIHFPILYSIDSYESIHDGYNFEFSALAEDLDAITFKVGTLDGIVKLGNENSVQYIHNATLCPNSYGTGTRISYEHEFYEVSGSSHDDTYYDKNGNVVGGGGGATFRCMFCNVEYSYNSGTTWNSGYSGGYYDKDGKYIGTTNGTNTSSSFSAVPDKCTGIPTSPGISASFGCTTPVKYTLYDRVEYTYPICTKHNNASGFHYYCNEHRYLGNSSMCSLGLTVNENYWGGAAYGYTKNMDKSIAVYPRSITSTNASLYSGYTEYASQCSGATNVLHNNGPKPLGYIINSGNATPVTGTLAVGEAVAYTTYGLTSISLEAPKLAQALSIQNRFSKQFNSTKFNLGVTVT